ncbi:ATP-binding protein [Candidatus Gottesmanbacteria bacterium]|nr:ATP-binding protein [Candidatus Gottesmanbacteria bacterium]
MKKPIQYLLVGFPYSGKTTLAKALENKLGFSHINIDQLKFDKGYKDAGDDDVPDKVWEEIFKEADKLITGYLKKGKNIANEYAWITKEWRDRARKVAREIGFETKVIYIKLPQDIIRQRWLENSKTKARFHWPEEEFKRYLQDFEEPAQDENVILYDQLTDVGEWINKNFK